VEILKQGQYDPMEVADQIMVIFAATNGYLDDLEVERIGDWEEDFLEWVHSARPEMVEKLQEEKRFADDLEERLADAVEEFGEHFQATREDEEDERANELEEELEAEPAAG